uniref:DNA-repair protein Xrcc1 N-terminal domain-containing protein n=1 Tax=Sinocyclocheilus grahami TaxID=75366 RepID=A0A672MV03_SINGR
MPEIKLKRVVACSSEDSTHKADNLLSCDSCRKWRAGEKHVSVILQLEKEEQIHSIDIGNEGSAFTEVLVGHSTSVKDQDFEVRLKLVCKTSTPGLYINVFNIRLGDK